MVAHPKPPTRASERAAERRHRAQVIRAVRAVVVARDHAGCRGCGWLVGSEMHEIVFRSQRRGLPPEQIFYPAGVVMLCGPCHRQVHAREIDLVPVDPERGADGPVEVQRRLRKAGGSHVET